MATIVEEDRDQTTEEALGLPPLSPTTKTELATLKLRLSPLLTAESSLADRLSGGVQVGSSAKKRGGGVYVRSGWQTTLAVSGRKRRYDESGAQSDEEGKDIGRDYVQEELSKISRMLAACSDDVKVLWNHNVVRTLIEKRKLRLQESADQCVSSCPLHFRLADQIQLRQFHAEHRSCHRSRLQTLYG